MSGSIEKHSGSHLGRQADSEIRLFCTFRAAGRLYGIDAVQVAEVSTQSESTPVPQAAPIVRGLANLRSRVFLVVDGRAMLGLCPEPVSSESRLILLKSRIAEEIGILVEQGGEIVRVDAAQIEAANSSSESDPALARATIVVGVCKMQHELMAVVDAAKIVGAVSVSMQ